MRLGFIVFLFVLSGCASNQLGEYAKIVPSDGSVPKVKITGRFNPQHCSNYFAYLDLSVENTTGDWQTLSDLKLSFPYQSDSQFAVVQGQHLAYWAEAERNRLTLKNHNNTLASLAVATLGLGLAATGDKKAGIAGAALYTGVVASQVTSSVSNQINRAETAVPNGRNYLVGEPIMIPPGMTRKFWLVLSASDEAPLMAAFGGTFKDGKNIEHAFNMVLNNWSVCRWQKARKAFLRNYVQQSNQPTSSRWAGEEEFNVVNVDRAALIRAEHDLQTHQLSSKDK